MYWLHIHYSQVLLHLDFEMAYRLLHGRTCIRLSFGTLDTTLPELLYVYWGAQHQTH